MQLNNEVMDWNLTHIERTGRVIIWIWCKKKDCQLYSKLKLWTFLWGHGESEWALIIHEMYQPTLVLIETNAG